MKERYFNMTENEIAKILWEAEDFDYENLVELLPENPLDVFLMGQYVGNTYSQTDMWLALDEKGNVFSLTDKMLFDSVIDIFSLAGYIAKFDDDKQKEILDELI